MVAKQVIVGVAAVLLGCGLPLAATWSALGPHPGIQDERAYFLDIPRLVVVDALKEFTAQTGLQISFWPDPHTDQSALVGPLRGEFTAESALKQLLASSGLAFRRTNDRSLVVMAPSLLGLPGNSITAAVPDRLPPTESPLDLHQRNRPLAQNSDLAAAGSPPVVDSQAEYQIDEVIVTGSRMERSGEGPAPVQVFTRRTIEALGAVSIPEVLRYMPQQPFNRAEFYYPSGAQYSQMRGIGVDTTLVLINGRRVVPTSNSLTLNAFDLNSIPLAAVEKIEVLSDSASAIYGADAMGGVVNVVLKKEISQPVIDVHYGGASGGAGLLRTSLSAGHSTDRFKASLIFDYHRRDALVGAERERWADQNFTRYGGTDYRSAAGTPGTVRSVMGGNLPGLPSSFAMVPYGSTGIDLTPADFVATAGMRNATSRTSTLSIIPEGDKRSIALFSELDLTPGLTLFAEALYSRRWTASQDEVSTQSALVPATHPFNPFGQPVMVDFLLGLAPRRITHDAEILRGAAGLRGSLGAWQYEVAASGSTETGGLLAANNVSATRVEMALAETDPARALNPFVDGPAGSAELLATLIEPHGQHNFSRGRQLSAFLRGHLFGWPAGPIQAVFGGEWHDEQMTYDEAVQAVDNGRDVTAFFSELRVPLIGAAGRGDVLSMTLAGRVDDYSDFGSTLNPQFGLMWRPVRDLLLRGSYGTSFRPPSLFELHMPRTMLTNIGVHDPARNDELGSVTLVAGGNPDLEPIEAESMSAGFVLTPSALPGLRLLGSYWKIKTENRVTLLHYTSLLDNEEALGHRIVRDTATPADIAAGMPGRLLQLDVSRMNFGRLTTSGVDLELAYEFVTQWGEITPRLSATWVNEFTSDEVPNTPPVDRVGVAHPTGSVPRWRVVGSLAWQRNGIGLSTTVDWLPGYLDIDLAGPTGRRLPSRALVDIQASFAMDELFGAAPLWDDLKLQAGVKNVFDELPPFAEAGFTIGFDSSQGDLVGRIGYLRLSKGF